MTGGLEKRHALRKKRGLGVYYRSQDLRLVSDAAGASPPFSQLPVDAWGSQSNDKGGKGAETTGTGLISALEKSDNEDADLMAIGMSGASPEDVLSALGRFDEGSRQSQSHDAKPTTEPSSRRVAFDLLDTADADVGGDEPVEFALMSIQEIMRVARARGKESARRAAMISLNAAKGGADAKIAGGPQVSPGTSTIADAAQRGPSAVKAAQLTPASKYAKLQEPTGRLGKPVDRVKAAELKREENLVDQLRTLAYDLQYWSDSRITQSSPVGNEPVPTATLRTFGPTEFESIVDGARPWLKQGPTPSRRGVNGLTEDRRTPAPLIAWIQSHAKELGLGDMTILEHHERRMLQKERDIYFRPRP